MRLAITTALVVVLGSAALAAPSLGEAKPGESGTNAEAEAVRRYRAGKQLIAAGKFAEALVELEASRELMPSPNTDLLLGHALRELGRKGEAMTIYEGVLADAGARVRGGERRFKPTLEEAGRWSAVLRVELGQLRLVVPAAPEGTTVEVDGAAVTAERDVSSGELRTSIWHEPGSIQLKVAGEGRERVEQVTLAAGQEQRLELPLPHAPSTDGVTTMDGMPDEAPDGAADEEAESSGPPLASWITAGIGVVGFGFFAGFGAASASTASDLDECAPACPTDMREQADDGATNQTVANVSLIVGATAIAAAGTIWLVTALVDDDTEATDAEAGTEPADAEVSFGLRPAGVALRGRF